MPNQDQNSKRFYISDLLQSASQYECFAGSFLQMGDYWGWYQAEKLSARNRAMVGWMEKGLKEVPGK